MYTVLKHIEFTQSTIVLIDQIRKVVEHLSEPVNRAEGVVGLQVSQAVYMGPIL